MARRSLFGRLRGIAQKVSDAARSFVAEVRTVVTETQTEEDQWASNLGVPDEGKDEEDAMKTRTRAVLEDLARNDVPQHVLDEIAAVVGEDWDGWFYWLSRSNGGPSSSGDDGGEWAQGGPPTDGQSHTMVHVKTGREYLKTLIYMAETSDIESLEIIPLAYDATEGHPLWDGESIVTTKGVRHGIGKKRPPAQKKGRSKGSHGRYTADEWRKKKAQDRSRAYRARKSEEKQLTMDKVTGKRFRRKVDRARNRSNEGKKK